VIFSNIWKILGRWGKPFKENGLILLETGFYPTIRI